LRQAQSGFKAICTTLALSAALAAGALSPSYARAFPSKAPLAETQGMEGKFAQAEKKGYRSGNAECGFDGNTFTYKVSGGIVREMGSERMLGKGETVHGVWCSEKRAFVLTSRKWIIIEAKEERQTLGQGSFSELFSYKDMTRILSKPFVSWVATDDRIFVQTDRIREIPLDGDIIIHGDGMDLRNAKMAVGSGFLFFAPAYVKVVVDGKEEKAGRLVVDQIGTDFSVEMDAPGCDYGCSFTKSDGKIRFGGTEIDPVPNPNGGFTINPWNPSWP
jgi:hypothetical protein